MPDVFTYLGYLTSCRRMVLGLGSGYRSYEFDGFGADFDSRRDVQAEAIDLILDLLHKRRVAHKGTAKQNSAEGIIRHLTHFMGTATVGYLGNVSEKDRRGSTTTSWRRRRCCTARPKR